MAADAANCLATVTAGVRSEDEVPEIAQAQDIMACAHQFRAAADVLVKYADPSEPFIVADLLPQPITPTQENQ